jgi:DNA-binding NarL/FixJ family response regulator
MGQLDAVILHRHVLFRDLIELELQELGEITVVGATNDPHVALDLVLRNHSGALVIETTEGFIDRHEMLRLFAAAAEHIAGFVLISANLATSEVEVLQDTMSEGAHLAGLKPLLHGALS